jgi:hypothetical protein
VTACGACVLVGQAVEDRFSTDVLCVDVSHGSADTVTFVVGNVLRDTLVHPSRVSPRHQRPGHLRQRLRPPVRVGDGAGYGPRRLREICAAAGDRLEPSLQSALDAAGKDPASADPIAGYACLYGGNDYQDRAAPGQPPWSRLHGFGPAFFTKFLYFSTPGALILDNRLANAVHRLSQLPNLVTEDGRSLTWTPYRYAVYLHWMTQTARAVGVAPELLLPGRSGGR